MQSAAVVDSTVNGHWSSQEWLVTGAQGEKPNPDWLMSVWWADSREVWRRVAWRGGWLCGLCGRGGWLRRNWWPGSRPLETPREISCTRQGWFRCRQRDREAISRDFGGFNMVDVYRPPHQVILICYLIGIRDSFDKEGTLPPWCQLTGALGSAWEELSSQR